MTTLTFTIDHHADRNGRCVDWSEEVEIGLDRIFDAIKGDPGAEAMVRQAFVDRRQRTANYREMVHSLAQGIVHRRNHDYDAALEYAREFVPGGGPIWSDVVTLLSRRAATVAGVPS